MNNPKPEVIGVADMIERRGPDLDNDPLSKITVELVNMLVDIGGPIRTQIPGIEGPLVAALVIYAGAVHGEILAMGMCGDLTAEAARKMLVTNWDSGVRMGKAKVERCAEEMGVDPVTGRKPE